MTEFKEKYFIMHDGRSITVYRKDYNDVNAVWSKLGRKARNEYSREYWKIRWQDELTAKLIVFFGNLFGK